MTSDWLITWLDLCKNAFDTLPDNQFTIWMFVVGKDGSDEYRCYRGEIVLRKMTGRE